MARIAAFVLVLFLLYCIAQLVLRVVRGGTGRPVYVQLFEYALWGIFIYFAGGWALRSLLK